jgi:hypothetical protein
LINYNMHIILCNNCISILTAMPPAKKRITSIVRPERLSEVREALFRAGVTGISISR